MFSGIPLDCMMFFPFLVVAGKSDIHSFSFLYLCLLSSLLSESSRGEIIKKKLEYHFIMKHTVTTLMLYFA